MTRERDAARLRLLGELDLATAPVLQAEIAAQRAAGLHRLIIDLAELDFMDSTGLRCILDCDAEARQDGFTVALIAGRPAIQRVFQLTKTENQLSFIEP